ncbi:MAG: four-carbon acid sugar kinase family protein, partial [Clostridia bacterium]|nr:four-carbon acid sugar kinase family protein [Clostridia bacterium]
MKKQADILTQYAEIDEAHVDALLQEELRRNRKKLVVLDDDPTGVQTVHDVSVYTHWTPEDLAAGFQEEENLFYVLTNSRGFTEAETIKAHREIAEATDKAAKAAGKEYLFVSRSDSTLRGHFPLETEILREEYEKHTGLPVDGEILCPFFKEGDRFTLDNIHYVKYGEELVPANETEFAKDPTFGYVSETLPEYVEEKTGGKVRKEAVACISLKDLHEMNFDRIQQQLMDVKDFNKVVVNAVDYPDLKVFCVALLRAIAAGKNFLFRTAASLVRVLGGISERPLLT